MTDKTRNDAGEIKKNVREYYASAINEKPQPASGCCCEAGGQTSCCGKTDILYEDDAVFTLPSEVNGISFGCGDPVTLASLHPGQNVLDLGCGGGIDCFLAAQKVGPSGHVIGVDMTPQMLDRARANKAKLNISNVDFRLGEIENLPVADATIDVVISNCVINLSPDKPRVFSEIYRVLKPGGKLAVSDIVTDGELPQAIQDNPDAWSGCVAGAIDVHLYAQMLEEAGFHNVRVTPVYLPDEMIMEAVSGMKNGSLTRTDLELLRLKVYSSKISAEKGL